MLKHRTVSAWHYRWKDFPVPNRFLGITQELAGYYEDIPFASKCAMRWQVHHERLIDLQNILGQDMHLIQYENLALNTPKIISELEEFLQLNSPINHPEVKTSSLNKWQSELTKEQINEIQSVVNRPPKEY